MSYRQTLAWMLLGMLMSGSPAGAQTSCTTTANGTLMIQLSDNAPAGSITPQVIRNVVCSTTRGLAAAGVQQTVGTSPLTFVAALPGKVGISSGKIEISGDAGANWYTVSFVGGLLPVAKNDQIRVTWRESGDDGKPAVTWFPGQ